MSGERIVDPEFHQALEEIEDTLRTERRALGSLPGENVELRGRLEKLQAEREQLRGELEGLRQGRAKGLPRLPEFLTLPFEVRPPVSVRRQFRETLPFLSFLGVLLIFLQDHLGSRGMYFLLALVGAAVVRAFTFWLGRSWWSFRETGIEGRGRAADDAGLVPYSEITEVKVLATASQRQRGVGTVQVTSRARTGEPKERVLLLKDAPEPERLAAWIEVKRSGVE